MRFRRARMLGLSVGVMSATLFAVTQAVPAGGAAATFSCPGGLLPDLRSVVPHQLQIQNTQQREYLRLSNAIVNLGAGPWHLHPATVLGDQGGTTTAIQDIWNKVGGASDPTASIACSLATTQFEFHAEHNHWHIGNVGLFELRYAADNGTGGKFGKVYVNNLGKAQSIKTTFCLIDWIKYNDHSNTGGRTYWACDRTAPYQGVSVGWMDQYHHSLPGMEVDFTGAPPGIYYLVVNANQSKQFVESNYTNNMAWRSIRITRDSMGNAKFEIIASSSCGVPTDDMCGDGLQNR